MKIMLVGLIDNDRLVRWQALLAGLGVTTEIFDSSARQFGMRLNSLINLTVRHPPLSSSLVAAIESFRPDVVHSFGTFDSGELMLAARATKSFRWIASSDGDDIGEFATLHQRKELIKQVRTACDRFVTEEVPPAGAGFLSQTALPRESLATSRRRCLLVEGNFGLYGRSLVALSAIERCQKALRGYTVLLAAAGREVVIASEFFERATGIPVKLIGPVRSARDLARYTKAALSLNLSIRHGPSETLLEAMRFGAVPIEARTGGAGAWLSPGKTGYLVNSDDPRDVENAIRQALSRPGLLDEAAQVNRELVKLRLDKETMRSAVLELYRRPAPRRHARAPLLEMSKRP